MCMQVFADLRDVVGAVLAGYNGTIISYGQTGSGKTHTLMGDIGCQQERGIVPRAVAELAKGIAAYPDPCKFRVRLHGVHSSAHLVRYRTLLLACIW